MSLISNIGNLIEKIVNKRLYSFLEKNYFLFAQQYGFRNKLSTNRLLLILQASDEKSADEWETSEDEWRRVREECRRVQASERRVQTNDRRVQTNEIRVQKSEGK